MQQEAPRQLSTNQQRLSSMAPLYELVDANGAVRAEAPADILTQHSMTVGDVFLGNLADPADHDWVRIELQPDTTYVMRLQGHGADPVTDPLLELYDAAGQRVAYNDDLFQGVLHSQIVFTTPAPSPEAGAAPLTYYLNARSYDRNPALRSDGDYRLSLDEQLPLQAPVPPPAAASALFEQAPNALTGSAGADVLRGDDANNVLDGGRGADVLDGGGQPADGHGDSASYRRADDAVTVSLETGTGAGGEAAGDVLIHIENLIGSDYDDTLSGDTGANILLGGPGDDTLAGGGGADLLLGGPGVDTVTYQRNFSNHGVRVDLAAGVADGASAEGDRLADIENLIGSSLDDKLYGTDESNRLWGSRGDDLLAGRGGADVFVFHQGDGQDTVTDFDPAEDRIELHLYYGQRFDWQELDIRTDGADSVIRIDGNNSLRLRGVAPAELGEQHFFFVGIARPAQTQTDDCDPGRTLVGGPDKDILVSGPCADTLDGGGDYFDVVSYVESNRGVIIDLSEKDADGYSTGSGGYAEGDRLINIEQIWGSRHNDELTGDDMSNGLWGLQGNDVLNGGPGSDLLIGGPGADTLDGGDNHDFDVASYVESNRGVIIDLSEKDADGYSTGSGGYAEGDRLINIEDIWGSDHDDTLTGDDDQNTLDGFKGNDILNGGPGADVLIGGPGADTLTGGPDNDILEGGANDDIFVFNSGDGSDTIFDFNTADDQIDLRSFDLTGFNDPKLSITSSGTDTVITVDNDVTIMLGNVTTAQVDADNFLFA